MTDLMGARVVIVGAGVLGLAAAFEFGHRGARCIVLDPAPFADNASGVAAGMLAPAFESALDPPCAGRLGLLRAARDLWPDFSARAGLAPPDRVGAVWSGPPESMAASFEREGAVFEPLAAAEARALLPGLALDIPALFTPEDWRIDAQPALAGLRTALLRSGGEIRPSRVRAVSAGSVTLDGEILSADAVLLCPGAETALFVRAAPELAVVLPVKGEILVFPGAAPLNGPTVRSSAGYLVPSAGGPFAGATMGEGVSDRRATAVAREALLTLAAGLFPNLAEAPLEHLVGVRAATPDALPLVGRSATGVWLAAGARRNGWLLAPMVAGLLADELAAVAPGTWASAFAPQRFA